jgi:hypothetical protein
MDGIYSNRGNLSISIGQNRTWEQALYKFLTVLYRQTFLLLLEKLEPLLVKAAPIFNA